ncbi:Dabb family protein [Auraticoccus sp. F435]|uniref:Dabb family protein n=1 Tax=Auraticoccus cholistanensis TaxID=2656650 RepID=A0A6A9V0E8_9ACTN|nr:Dabb family protein [Auraticoccus cholistanensis]MVA75469.1 Dabb family protein [Auraticoccus cholistanensis]
MSQVTHVVLVTWKDGREGTVEEWVRPAVRRLAQTIPGIVDLVEGWSTSSEGLEDGLEYGFVMTFADAAARDAYLPDPRHRVVADMIGEHAQRVVVFDI